MKKKINPSVLDIIVEPCEEGGFFAHCPKLPGCHAEGETYGAVIDTLREVIAAHISLRKKQGDIPIKFTTANKKEVLIHVSLPVGVQ